VSRSATLAQIVADGLRQSLRDGVYVCGERLVELTIAHDMNVSQNTVRDALRILEQEGWVVKRARYGAIVRDFTLTEAEELYTLWSTLEQLALGWAMERMTSDDVAQLRRELDAAYDHAQSLNVRALQEALFKFHASIASIADKSQTAIMLKHIRNQIRLLENVREAHDPRTRSACMTLVEQYNTLIEQIANRNPIEACRILHQIIMTECRSILPLLETRYSA
jgi:DNA-binding GntR family transcriptional regulator